MPRETAEPIAHELKVSLIVIAELCERNWGELEGRPRSLQRRGVTPPGAETREEFEQRVLRGLRMIGGGGRPLLVAHSGIFRVLCRALEIVELKTPIANGLLLRFMPPDRAHKTWRIELPQD